MLRFQRFVRAWLILNHSKNTNNIALRETIPFSVILLNNVKLLLYKIPSIIIQSCILHIIAETQTRKYRILKIDLTLCIYRRSSSRNVNLILKKKKRLFSREVLFLFLIIIILTYSNIEGVENFHLKRIFIEDSKYFRTKLKKKTHIYWYISHSKIRRNNSYLKWWSSIKFPS